MTTQEAFEQIIYDDRYRLSLPLEEQRSLAAYKSKYLKGELNLSRIDAFIEKHGFKVHREKLWIKKEEA